jgi:hypothetical protein
MNCYSCDQAAINACKRCAKTYCADHGNATYCADCLAPASAMPSFNLYRGALLFMLVGTAVAIFLLVRPPGDTSGSPAVSVGQVTPTVTPRGGAEAPVTPGAQDTPPQSEVTPAPTQAPTQAPAAEPTVGFREYVVQEGDSLYGIAEATIAPGDDIDAYARAIATLNGWTLEDAPLIPGETILLPPLPE